jgi:hypothetical protein
MTEKLTELSLSLFHRPHSVTFQTKDHSQCEDAPVPMAPSQTKGGHFDSFTLPALPLPQAVNTVWTEITEPTIDPYVSELENGYSIAVKSDGERSRACHWMISDSSSLP